MGPNYSLIQICTADDEFKKRELVEEIFKHIYQTCFRIYTIVKVICMCLNQILNLQLIKLWAEVNDLGDNCLNVDLNQRAQLVR